jgi:hypothetical protein
MSAESSRAVIDDNNSFTGPLVINGGNITTNTLWDRNRVYYILGTVAVNNGAVLTLTPGRIVKFERHRYLSVSGTLIATGTLTNSITFTSIFDDTAGGDTNNDEGSTTPYAGSWSGIYLSGPGSAVMEHCEVRYSGAYYYGEERAASIYVSGSVTLILTNSLVITSEYRCVALEGTNSTHLISGQHHPGGAGENASAWGSVTGKCHHRRKHDPEQPARKYQYRELPAAGLGHHAHHP